MGLAREKPYASIAVKEILDRANVGRSTFYTHFRDKDELLESGIYEMLRSLRARPRTGSLSDRLVAFSLPILEHIADHRRATAAQITREGRAVMHEHLQGVLKTLIADELETATSFGQAEPQISRDLVARHVASTFVLVLDWWLERDVALTAVEIDARFRALVLPTLAVLDLRALRSTRKKFTRQPPFAQT